LEIVSFEVGKQLRKKLLESQVDTVPEQITNTDN
jgi:hypothetical protein